MKPLVFRVFLKTLLKKLKYLFHSLTNREKYLKCCLLLMNV